MNTDAKILAKIFARRLEIVLPKIISKDQKGFIKGHHSYFNIRRLFNIVYSSSTDSDECVVSLDAEKAFDRVQFDYLFAVLDRFGFGAKFTSSIKLLYSQPSATIQTNLQLSKPFKLHRGTRQGCLLSPLPFDLAIELLAIAFRSCKEVHGIWRNNTEHDVSLYADNLLLFISKPLASLPSALNLLSQFGQISGYKLNLNKSELFSLSSKASMLDSTCLPFRVERKKKITYLGITVTKKHKNLFKENVSALLNQVKLSLTHWTPLSTSLVGRINSIKMTILPKFLYLFQALPIFIPNTFFNELDSVISSYLWQGKRPRLNKMHLQKSKIEGGFALPNF